MNMKHILNIFYGKSRIIETICVILFPLLFKEINIYKLFIKLDTSNKLIFLSTDYETSKRYRAIMYWISKLNNKSIKSLSEITDWKYNYKLDTQEETRKTFYKVDQPNVFWIDEVLKIKGIVYEKEKEKTNQIGKTNVIKYNCLEIFSNNVSLLELEKWVEKRLEEFDIYIQSKSYEKQMLIEISWNDKIEIYHNSWSSNVTFENRFFNNKEEILNKINFFLKNPEWYKNKGIPYTLGLLLWGEPGCGKTGFIKALMNLTKRHGVSIKLNNKFNMNKLREIIYNNEISEDLIITQENRILIFEDIDCMDEVVKDRDIINKKSSIQKKNNNFNNNLSFFLNLLDGLYECPGRIIIMTTNKPEQLDKALIRPGRIDYNIHFTKATIIDIKNIIQFYWNKDVEISIKIEKYFSHAEIINFCRTSETIIETLNKINNTKYKNESKLVNKDNEEQEIEVEEYEYNSIIYHLDVLTNYIYDINTNIQVGKLINNEIEFDS